MSSLCVLDFQDSLDFQDENSFHFFSLFQSKRLGSLNKFKAKARSILLATDVASRGLDIPHVDVVVNFDIPTHSKVSIVADLTFLPKISFFSFSFSFPSPFLSSSLILSPPSFLFFFFELRCN